MALTGFKKDSHHRLDLSGDKWQLCCENRIIKRWDDSRLSAKVPGCVHLDLMAADLIPDPFYGMNEKDVQWINDEKWIYSRKFTVCDDDIIGGEFSRNQLVFEGLDTFAEIFLDGELFGKTENMFVPHRFDLPPTFKTGEHELSVHFSSPTKAIDDLVKEKGAVPDSFGGNRGWVRKAGYSYGWDWGPILPTSGIFRPLYIQSWGFGRIGWFNHEFSPDGDGGKVLISGSIQSEINSDFRLTANLKRNGENLLVSKNVSCVNGNNSFQLQIEKEEFDLWWPNGYGEAALYDLTLKLSQDEVTIHQISEKIGLRTVEWVQEEDEIGKSFFIRVNGRAIFAKGANWIPTDNFLTRVPPELYRRQFEFSCNANMNMLRVWGGGLYEDPEFYRLANEFGIMIWQDFPYACALYPDDPDFRENAIDEAKKAVAALSRYSSIVLWCGNNEIERDAEEFQHRFGTPYLGKTLWTEQLADVVKEILPNMMYIPSSPIGGDIPNAPEEGDCHIWSVWSGWDDYPEYLKIKSRFISEFGFQAPANYSTLCDALDSDDRNIQSEAFEWHNKQIEGPEKIIRFLSAHHKIPTSFERFVLLSQDVQGRALRLAVENWRGNRPETMGTLIWQLNDCWPVTSWSLIDSALRPKASYYQVKRGYKEKTIALLGDSEVVKLKAINDSDSEWSSEIYLKTMNLQGETVKSDLVPLTIEADSAAIILEIEVKEWINNIDNEFLVADIQEENHLNNRTSSVFDDTSHMRSVWLPRRMKHMNLPDPEITVERIILDNVPGVRIISDGVAFGVRIEDNSDPDLMLADNLFDLLPGDVLLVATVNSQTGKPAEIKQPVYSRI
jgi:beta-mannosidase